MSKKPSLQIRHMNKNCTCINTSEIKALRLYPSDKRLVGNMKKGFLTIQLI